MICRKCKKEIPDESAFCLHCGAAQETKERTPKRRGNGQGSVYKRGKTWMAVVTYYGRGKRETATQGGFKTRTEAVAAASRLREELERGIIKKVNYETLRTLYIPWSESAMLKLSKSRQVAYKIAWNKIDDIADEVIGNITISDLQDILDEKAQTYYTARDIKTLLSHLYKRAVAQGDAKTNLSQFLVLPSLDEKEGVPFNADEIKIFWKHFEDGELFPCYILLMIYSGMMPGELIRAEKNMIDWNERTIFGCGIKTKERKRRPIVFPDFIIPVLQRICDTVSGDKLLYVCRDTFYDEFKSTLERYGCRILPPYSCRHTTGNSLAMSEENIPAATIKAVMRQRRFTTTQRYIHPDTANARDAVDKLKK
jgi:integrase